MPQTRYEDSDGNIYVLVKAPELKKGDPTCRGCHVRAASRIPGCSFCTETKYQCQIPFNEHVWYQVKWGAYPNAPERPVPASIE